MVGGSRGDRESTLRDDYIVTETAYNRNLAASQAGSVDRGLRHFRRASLPPEKALCELYDISRPTVRQAISEVAQDGQIVRYKGSFIDKKKIS